MSKLNAAVASSPGEQKGPAIGQEPLFRHVAPTDPEALLERFYLQLDGTISQHPAGPAANGPSGTVPREIPPDNLLLVLVVLAIVAGTVMVLLAGF